MRFSLLIFLLAITSGHAQYRTESWDLEPGWNAIFLNVDTELRSLDALLAGKPDITDVWQWRPSGLDPSVGQAEEGADEWRVWRRGDVINSTFSIPLPNTAYLVRLKSDASPQTLSLKGKVVAPRVQWRTDGSNLVGFPIKSGETPKLNRYLQGAGVVDNNTEAYRYVGGELNASNPVLSPARLIDAKRGQAYWIRSDKYTDFYGPVQVSVALDDGLHFGASAAQKRVVLTNRTDEEVEVTLTPALSEVAPDTVSVLTAPPLTIRSRNAEGLHIYTPLGASQTVTVPAQDSVGLTLGVDRASMGGVAGDQFAGLLRVTDDGDFSEIYLPVTAEKTSLAGLWVGEAQISHVQNQLQRFQREDDGTYSVDSVGKHIPLSSETGLNEAAQVFKFRLIAHVDESGSATLLSQAFAGVISDDGEGNTLVGLSTQESSIHPDHLKTAVRLSSAAFPNDLVQALSGSFSPGNSLTANISLGANHPSNPFLHIYHPDHDNKDARFENVLPAGIESHSVNRAINLTFNAAPGPGEGPQWGTTLLSGTFSETVTGIHKQPIAVSGIFVLGKVSDIAVLQTP